MNWKIEYKSLLWITFIFLGIYFLPLHQDSIYKSIYSSLYLLQWYAREHVILCLLPALFIAGAIAVFVKQAAVIKYFGAEAPKWISYLISSVSGSILAVCSCTILPLFAGIYKRGAGIGPATTFLYAGPAINILAIILTARILGLELGIARIIGAITFSVLIGLLMQTIFKKEDAARLEVQPAIVDQKDDRPLWQTLAHFFVMIAILITATLADPQDHSGLWYFLYQTKWLLTGILAVLFSFSLVFYLRIKSSYVIFAALPVIVLALILPQYPILIFSLAIINFSVLLSLNNGEPQEWMQQTWGFTRQILPLLALGVLIAGFLLGSPEGHKGLIPGEWISSLVGGNSLLANLFASVVGALMYFATLTEVPILEGLIGNGMGKGPALALLLSGPAVSLPNMLVIRSVIGTKKTMVFLFLVIVMATLSGLIYGMIF